MSAIMIVDDHPTVREGLKHRIAAQPDMSVCGEASDVQEAMKMVPQLRPKVVIVDIGLRTSNGLDLVKQIKARFNNVRTLVHSMYDESVYVERCLHAGAMGYVNKAADPNDVIKAIRDILAGRIYLSEQATHEVLSRTLGSNDASVDPVERLSDRQLEVFRLIGDGWSVQEIAKQLHISVHTVDSHRENIKRKLNVETSAELTRCAVLWQVENR